MSEENNWKRGPVEAYGQYWVVSGEEMMGEEKWEPYLGNIPKGLGDPRCWYKLREAAPERPVIEEPLTDYDEFYCRGLSPKIKPVAGKWYIVRDLNFSETVFAEGDFEQVGGTPYLNTPSRSGPWHDEFEILAEIPSPEEYLKKMGKENE